MCNFTLHNGKTILATIFALQAAYCLCPQEPKAEALSRLYVCLVQNGARVTLEGDNGVRDVFLANGEFSDEMKIVGVALKPTKTDWQRKFPKSSGETWLKRPILIDELNLVIASGADHYTANDYEMRGLLEQLCILPNLDTLSLAFCSVTDDVLSVLSKRQFVSLNLASTDITDKSGMTLSQMINLQELNVGDTGVSDELLNALGLLNKLTTLGLSGTSISNNSADIIREFGNLKVLRVHNTAVSDAFVQRLTPLATLQVLDISKTGISDASVEHLAKFVHLEMLDLNDTAITIGAIRRLLDLPKLRRLSIHGRNCTEIEITQIKKDFAWVQIDQ